MYLVRKLQQNFLSWMTFVTSFIYVFLKASFVLFVLVFNPATVHIKGIF